MTGVSLAAIANPRSVILAQVSALWRLLTTSAQISLIDAQYEPGQCGILCSAGGTELIQFLSRN